MRIRNIFVSSVLLATISILGCADSSQPETSQPPAETQPGDGGEVSTSDGTPDATAGSDTESVTEQPGDIVDTAIAAGNFTTLAAALTAAELVDTLKSDGPFTVFAPTDEAFAKLPEGTLANVLKPENKDQLVSILTYHVVPGNVNSTAVASLTVAGTVNGAEIAIDASADGVKINDVNVTTADIACSNGIIHVIDAVLLPPTKSTADAPHAGEPLSVEGVGSFKTLFTAIEAAGLKDTLEKDGPFTIFAPTDKAFAALADGTVESLLKPENKEQLVAILTFHVVAGKVPSSKVVELTRAKTVNGAEVTIEVADGKVRVNGATVLKTDVPCEVGLIHAIDKVLLP